MKKLTGATVEVTGLSEVRAALQDLSKAVVGKALADAVRAGAAVIRDEAKRRAPVGSVPHYVGRKAKGRLVKPGNLRRQIRMKRVRGDRLSATYKIGFTGLGFYGRFLEFGTAKMSARPILRPAFESKKHEAVAVIKERLARNIERARKRVREASMQAYRGE